MTTSEITLFLPSWPRQFQSLTAWPARLWKAWMTWRLQRRNARALQALSDHMLKDIGVARSSINFIVSNESRR